MTEPRPDRPEPDRPEPRRPELGFYGDDVTGSVDVLLQAARRGAQGCLFIGTPAVSDLRAAAGTHPVVGIAGIARSLPPDALEAEVRPALDALAAMRPRIVQYKACSTADSSPQIGSLGRVLEIGREVFGARAVPMLFAQPDFGRYTVFGQHFAAEGGVVHRLDRQPTMSTHPSTPMDESDLVVHLARQTRLPVAAVHLTRYGSAGDLAATLDGATSSPAVAGTASSPEQPAGIVLDALDDRHLVLIGEAVTRLAEAGRPLFVIGSGGLSRAVLAHRAPTPVSSGTPRSGPVLAISGSRSPQTRRQIRAAETAGWVVLPLSDAAAHTEVVAHLRAGRSVALTTEDATEFETAADPLAAIARAATESARAALAARATARLIICGGDTSSRVVRALGVARLAIVANPQGNVVLLRSTSTDPAIDGIDIVLKGGQVGDDDLFETVRRG